MKFGGMMKSANSVRIACAATALGIVAGGLSGMAAATVEARPVFSTPAASNHWNLEADANAQAEKERRAAIQRRIAEEEERRAKAERCSAWVGAAAQAHCR